MKKLVILFVLVLILNADETKNNVLSPSFDCSKAISRVEKQYVVIYQEIFKI